MLSPKEVFERRVSNKKNIVKLLKEEINDEFERLIKKGIITEKGGVINVSIDNMDTTDEDVNNATDIFYENGWEVETSLKSCKEYNTIWLQLVIKLKPNENFK